MSRQKLRVHNFSVSLDGYAAGLTDGTESALDRAFDAAGNQDVRLGGGAATIRQYLRAGLIDELHFAIVPRLLGAGERLFEDLGPDLYERYECADFVGSSAALHARLVHRTDDGSG